MSTSEQSSRLGGEGMTPSEKLNKDYQELCLSIGHLFVTFARVEGTLGATLKLHLANKMGKINDAENVAVSSAIYGGLRFTAARDTIKRLMSVEKPDQALVDFALGVFSQIGHIQDLRDKIAHQQLVQAFEGSGSMWQLVDTITSREIRNPKVFVFDTDAVSRAGNDLNTAAHRLGGNPGPGILDGLLNDVTPIEWLYRPSMLRYVPLSELRAPLP